MKKTGPLLIMLAASLWAIDALFRTALTFKLSSAVIVFIEHIVGFIILLPFLIKDFNFLLKLPAKTWLAIFSMSALSSVIGTLMFTQALNQSYALNDFATPILLQKLQPVFVVLFSILFLKEKVNYKFFIWSGLALFGSYLISFGFNPAKLQFQEREWVYLLSLGAAFSWATGTILSKYILRSLNYITASALRFAFAIPFAFIGIQISNQQINLEALGIDVLMRFIIIGGVTGGAFAIFLYYNGLRNTQAKIATFAELAFPIVSIFIAVTSLNPYGEPQILSIGNIAGIIILLVSIIKISFTDNTNKKEGV